MKCLHCVLDEKFIDGAISLFEEDRSVENMYVYYTDVVNTPFHYIKSEIVIQRSLSLFRDDVKQFDVVYLHSLKSLPPEIIPQIPRDIKVVWFGWGWDMYEGKVPIIPIKLYMPETAKVYNRCNGAIAQVLKQVRNKLLRVKEYSYFKQLLSRIDYFSGVFPYEYSLIQKEHPYFKAVKLDYYYGSTSFFIPDVPDYHVQMGKKNIIIGNSSNPTNNHLDVLKILKNSKCSDFNSLIIPLSYGGDPDYVKIVKKSADKLFPNKVNALDNFLPLNEYFDLVKNCKTAIYAHERQQASDNIFMQILYGSRVFLSEHNLAFTFLRNLGLHIYSLQTDTHLLGEELSEKEVLENRTILSKLYCSKSLIERVYEINRILNTQPIRI